MAFFINSVKAFNEDRSLVNGIALFADGLALLAPGVPAVGGAGVRAVKGLEKGGTEVVERWMTKDELLTTERTNLLRGGRPGTHYVTDSANSNALRARQRLALPQTPTLRVKLEVPVGVLSSPTRVYGKYGMPGGGMERTAVGDVPVKVLKVYE